MNLDGQLQDHTIFIVIFHLLILILMIITETTILAIDSKELKSMLSKDLFPASVTGSYFTSSGICGSIKIGATA